MYRDSSGISLAPLGCCGTSERDELAAALHKGVSCLWGCAPSTCTKARRKRKDWCELAACFQYNGQVLVQHHTVFVQTEVYKCVWLTKAFANTQKRLAHTTQMLPHKAPGQVKGESGKIIV